MVRLCSCGFGTDDDDWLTCHLIEHPGHREVDSTGLWSGSRNDDDERQRDPFAVDNPRRDPQVARGIRRVRLERGWRLLDVARLLGCDPSRISRIENGERGTPDPAEAAAKLGVPLPDLIAPCPRCGYQPPHGYLCLRCGTQAGPEQ